MGVPDSTVVVLSSWTAPSKWKWPLRGFFVAAVLTQLHYLLLREPSSIQPLCTRGAHHEQEFNWYKLLPSAKLKWVPCFKDYYCTRLEVPLDYSEPEGEKSAVALIKLPANVSSFHASYRGPILFNPGGPGGSGVELIKRFGKLFHEVLGDDYDIIGFDPRGIGYTTRVVNVFGSDDLSRAVWTLKTLNTPLLNQTTDALPHAIVRARLYNELIAVPVHHAAHHTNTAVVSRDMLSIVEAHGQEKLQYWGFSYGTILGATFASLYPDKVGRVVVDGVADAIDYYKGLWSNNLIDTDREVLNIVTECSQKPGDCPLYEPAPSLVLARLEKILSQLRTSPVPVHNSTNFIRLIDRNTVFLRLFQSLYKPYTSIAPFFHALAELEKGNPWPLHEETAEYEPKIDCKCSRKEDERNQDLVGEGPETRLAVSCNDAGPLAEDPDFLKEWLEKLIAQSQFGEYWGHITLGCAGWKVKPKWKWNGPIGGNTSFPLLFVGNTADPVTPLWAAKKISKRFKDAAVLTQDSMGHCSLAATSVCTQKAIRAYFRDGVLPKEGTVCSTSDSIFGNNTASMLSVLQDLKTEEDRRIFDVARRMSQQIELPRLGGK